MAVVYNQHGEATTNGEPVFSKNIVTCGDCKHYNNSTTQETELGPMHVCDKGSICNYWNFTSNCKYFEAVE